MDSYFEKGIKLNGTLWVKGDVHFNADIKGLVYSSDHFIVGPLGYLEGDIPRYVLTEWARRSDCRYLKVSDK